jgi:hypothetical protein
LDFSTIEKNIFKTLVELAMMVHTYNLSTQEAESGGLGIQVQPWLHIDNLSLKTKTLGCSREVEHLLLMCKTLGSFPGSAKKLKFMNSLRHFHKIYRIPTLIESYNKNGLQRLGRKERKKDRKEGREKERKKIESINGPLWPSMVVHTCNLSSKRLRQEDHQLKPSLGNIVRLCLKKVK